MFFLLSDFFASGQTIWHVKANATGLNNGTSWANAFTDLQPALDAASASADFSRQIWVAAGTYLPTLIAGNGTEGRDKTFRLLPNVKLYGGFAGNEPADYNVTLRNVAANKTILSGDIGAVGNNTDNCYHVVISVGSLGAAEINGFTITGGYANGSADSIIVNGEQFDRKRCGGIYNVNNDNTLVIANCTVTGNNGNASGAIFNYSSSPDILNCIISNNIATDRGFRKGGAGGINNRYNSSPRIINCLITGNKGDDGGGILNSTISGATIINCTITGNTSLGATGENNENAFGGGVSNLDYSSTTIYNSIVWGNTARADNNLSNYDSTSIFYVFNSTIEGGFTGGAGNLDADPGFIDPIPANRAPTSSGDYKLRCASPAINNGHNERYNSNIPADLSGNTRIIGSAIDMGAYEYQTQNIIIRSIAPSSPFRYCPGNSLAANFTINDCLGNFKTDNIFTLQLSDIAGNFSSPITIGTLASDTAGTITSLIPTNTPPGNGYRIRIVSSNQSFTSEVYNVAVTILPNETPSIMISANTTQICAGDKVSFTAAVINGGASPVYQWKKNGNNVGTNSNSYSDNGLTSLNVILCELTNTESCVAPATAFSNKISITVATITPTISIIVDNRNICYNGTANFTTVITGGGNKPTFQWKKNGTNIGGNSAVYSSAGLTSTDIITCGLTSSAACANPSIILSNELKINVNPIVAPAIRIQKNKEAICPGESLTFTAIIENGGSNPVFQWEKNDINVGTNNISYTDATMLSTDIIACELLSNARCASPQVATSNELSIAVGLVTPAITIHADKNEICKNETIHFSAVISDGGNSPVYQWRKNGVTVGTNFPGWSDATLLNADIISCILTSSYECVTQNPVESNVVQLAINPLPVISLSKSNDINCTTGEARLMATGGVKYEWQPEEGIEALSVNNPIVHPSKTTVYTVKVITDKNCSDTKDIIVTVASLGKYEIPNSFTPNNDGKNDCFGVGYLLNIANLDFSIYNRYGRKVFYTNDPKQCWDGKYGNHEQVAGAYIYVIRATGDCGIIDRNGMVLLIR